MPKKSNIVDPDYSNDQKISKIVRGVRFIHISLICVRSVIAKRLESQIAYKSVRSRKPKGVNSIISLLYMHLMLCKLFFRYYFHINRQLSVQILSTQIYKAMNFLTIISMVSAIFLLNHLFLIT
jgi:hypothetical protein